MHIRELTECINFKLKGREARFPLWNIFQILDPQKVVYNWYIFSSKMSFKQYKQQTRTAYSKCDDSSLQFLPI